MSGLLSYVIVTLLIHLNHKCIYLFLLLITEFRRNNARKLLGSYIDVRLHLVMRRQILFALSIILMVDIRQA